VSDESAIELFKKGGSMTDELKEMLLDYLRDMTKRGDYQAKLLLSLLEE